MDASRKECSVCLCMKQNMCWALGVTGAREFVRVSRTGKPDDLLNSVIGGFGSGAILGRLQGQNSGPFCLCVLCICTCTCMMYYAHKHCKTSFVPLHFSLVF